MEKRIKYGGSFLLLLLAGMALYVYIYEYRLSSGKPVLVQEAEIRISARDLAHSFDSSETLSVRHYLYKVLSVKGRVGKIQKNEQGDYTIELTDNVNEPGTISCSLDSIYKSHPPTLRAGDPVAIRGICAGYLSNVLMVQCIIEK